MSSFFVYMKKMLWYNKIFDENYMNWNIKARLNILKKLCLIIVIKSALIYVVWNFSLAPWLELSSMPLAIVVSFVVLISTLRHSSASDDILYQTGLCVTGFEYIINRLESIITLQQADLNRDGLMEAAEQMNEIIAKHAEQESSDDDNSDDNQTINKEL